MRLIQISFCCFLFLGCKHSQKDLFDESNYSLVKVDSFHGHLDKRYFTCNFDADRKMTINYWYNGLIQVKGFTNHGYLDGKLEMYDNEGRIMHIDSFSNGKKVFSKDFYKRDTSARFFNNGVLSPLGNPDSVYEKLKQP